MKINGYLFNDIKGVIFKAAGEELFLDIDVIQKAILKTNSTIEEIRKFDIDIFSLLGMRNLSAFIGEVFVSSTVGASNGLFRKNPHQDGYPDLLAMTEYGKKEWDRLKNNLQDKKPFSPFKSGGIEVKATCGSVPTPEALSKRGMKKPIISESRIDIVTGYDWKAHHRETNNLIGIFWDFIGGKPTIAGLFYSSDLCEEDWGKIIKPKEAGGRTTSVSIMTRDGVGKMCQGWIAVIDDERYIRFFNKYNKGEVIKPNR